MPKVSIILSVKNGDKFIDRMLSSIKDQTYKDFECLIINNGSIDNTEEICNGYITSDNRFKLFNFNWSGLSRARNTGLELSKGDLVMFIDCDDYLASDYLEQMVPLTDEYGIVRSSMSIHSNRYDKIDDIYGRLPEGLIHVNDNMLFNGIFNDVGHVIPYMYKKSFIGDIRFKYIKNHEDLLFNMELMFKHKQLYIAKNVIGYHYCRFNNSACFNQLSYQDLLRYYDQLELKYKISNPIFRNYIQKLSSHKTGDDRVVDIVIPYVDSNDPNWTRKFHRHKNQFEVVSLKGDGDVKVRYAPSESLRYVFRSIDKYVPWVNKIHLLVSDESQVPDWIDTTKINIVLHKDVIPQRFLPTFNSSTIEMFIWNIPELSDNYLYLNDDFIFNGPVIWEDYFSEYRCKNNVDTLDVRSLDKDTLESAWFNTFNNALDVSISDLNITYDNIITFRPNHITASFNRYDQIMIYKLFEKVINDSCTKFREVKNINQYIYTLYDYFHYGRMASHNRTCRYFQIHSNIMDKIADALNNEFIKDICLNDTPSTDDVAREVILILLNNKFPDKCTYEI